MTIGQDGVALLEKIYFDPNTPLEVKQLAAVETLRQIWLQRFTWIEGRLMARERKDMPAAAQLIQSPFDLQARFSRKRSMEWIGYKTHITETCDDERPHLITHVVTTLATQPDVKVTEQIHHGLEQLNCLPDMHLVDNAYTSGPLLVESQRDYQVELMGPVRDYQSWQYLTGYDHRAFAIDWERRQVTCPQGHHSQSWSVKTSENGYEMNYVKFRAENCQPCPVRGFCTKGKKRMLTFSARPIFEAMSKRSQEQHTKAFRRVYAKRAGIEGTISQSVFALGMRRSRYRNLAKTHLQSIFTALAINLNRMLNWMNEKPRATTRLTRFGKLQEPATAA